MIKQSIAKNNLMICQHLISRREKRRKRRFWIHPINARRASVGEFHTLWDDLVADEERFKRYLRMDRKCFHKLLEMIEPRLI